MADYWKNRLFEAQKKWTDKDIDVINKILRHYYKIARENIVEDFEAVYDKVLAQAEEGKPITPADLYKLDRYYQTQALAIIYEWSIEIDYNIIAEIFAFAIA